MHNSLNKGDHIQNSFMNHPLAVSKSRVDCVNTALSNQYSMRPTFNAEKITYQLNKPAFSLVPGEKVALLDLFKR